MSRRGIADLERGARRFPHPDTVRRLADALRLNETSRAALLAAAGRGTNAPAAVGGSPPGATLPIQLTTFVGRERERAGVKREISNGRLVTLTGSGGVGKTRLALQVATEMQGAFTNGICLVELATVSDGRLVPRTAAAALGITEVLGQRLTVRLTAALKSQELLLVIDNCEHLVDACVELLDHLLRTCPQLRVLATSRQRLGVSGEIAWRVPSMSMPVPGPISATDALAASEAERLFIDRARLVVPGFAISDGNAAAVAQICRRLDGIPLAIELAAARLLVLGPEQIEARLDDAFRVLAGGSRTAPSRQQTLRAALDWSYGLLPPAERALFRRLCLFAGGFSLESAETIGVDDATDSAGVLDLLSQLVDKSLIVADADASGSVRYRILETVRQYGQELLALAGELEPLSRRHALYFLDLVEQTQSVAPGSAQEIETLDRYEREYGNFRAALRWAIDRKDSDLSGRLIVGLYRVWYLRGNLNEGRRWFDQVLGLELDSHSRIAARARRGAGLLAYAEGDYVAARMHTECGLTIARELQDTKLVATALNNLGIILIDQGDYPEAQARCAEGLALAREIGDEPAAAVLLNNLGLVALYQGEYDPAIPLLDESLRIAQRYRMVWAMAWSTGNLGNIAFHQGDLVTARVRLRESLRLGQDIGDKRVIAERLEELGCVACGLGPLEAGVVLFGAAVSLREAIGAPMPPFNRQAYERSIATARTRLGATSFGELWQRGRRLPVEEAISAALTADTFEFVSGAGLLIPGGLTPRERDVARLVARGLSNRQIADTLIVSVRTAEAHVTHILTKLGLQSRAQLAVWAVEHDLTAN